MPRSDAPALDALRKQLLHTSYTDSPAQRFIAMVDQLALVLCGQPGPAAGPAQVMSWCELYRDAVAQTSPFDDLLGDLYMQIASAGHRQLLGQYFTPRPVATLQWVLAMEEDAVRPRLDGGLHRLCDPASGSGGLVLAAAANLLSRAGPDILKHWSSTLVDLDRICSRMSAVQLLTNCMVHDLELGELVVFHGDSLGASEAWRLVVHAVGKSARTPRHRPAPGR